MPIYFPVRLRKINQMFNKTLSNLHFFISFYFTLSFSTTSHNTYVMQKYLDISKIVFIFNMEAFIFPYFNSILVTGGLFLYSYC